MDRTVQLAQLAFPNIDPVALRLGPLDIHWYGVGYVVGILFAWWYSRKLVSDSRLWGGKQAPIKADDLDDFLTWAVIGIIVGGRMGYVFFYDFATFMQNPLSIFAVWSGGMSFHGGLLGVFIAMLIFARRRGFSPFSLFDVIAASVPIGIMTVRITNFINAELYGKPTDLPWAFVFPGGGPEPRHPSQLYEAALEGLIMFFILRVLTHNFKKLPQPGFVAGAFVLWYAISRIMIEFVRLPDAQIGYLFGSWLTMGMVLSLPMALVGIWAIATSQKRA
ncbi:MAG: prolipoprotein diacylglyceryl transferase [Rhizobiaceae bacterium]|nr:prolipoprotein diacylglyceryl transferase [Rhizobiaceae bacterium]